MLEAIDAGIELIVTITEGIPVHAMLEVKQALRGTGQRLIVPPGAWKPLPPPQQGEWRWRFPEKGQTLREYKAARPTRPTAARQTVYLQPFLTRPPPDRRDLERIAALLEGFFARKVTTLPPRSLPPAAYVRGRRQVDVSRLARALVRTLPPDAPGRRRPLDHPGRPAVPARHVPQPVGPLPAE